MVSDGQFITSPPAQPDQSSQPRRGKLGLVVTTIVLLLLVVGAAWFFIFHWGTSAPSTAGFAGRTTSPENLPDRPLAGSCFTRLSVLPAGRSSDGQQHYLASLTLKDNPTDQPALVHRLNQTDCNQERVQVTTLITQQLPNVTAKDAFVISFIASGGQRFYLPN